MTQNNLADVGLVGLAVMGQNLVMNMADKGYKVAVFNRTYEKVTLFLENEAASYKNIIGANSIKNLVDSLSLPRKIILLVKAGDAVDDFIKQIVPFLSKGDIIIGSFC